MQLHQKAPQFTLPDQDGVNHTLKDYQGKWVILYFYPKDDTPGCTTEACAFRDAFEDFQKHDVVVLGISLDSIDSHKDFAQKHQLNFPILADTDAEVSKVYGAWALKLFNDKPGVKRETFLINPDGIIVKHYENVDPVVHAKDIMQDLKDLGSAI